MILWPTNLVVHICGGCRELTSFVRTRLQVRGLIKWHVIQLLAGIKNCIVELIIQQSASLESLDVSDKKNPFLLSCILTALPRYSISSERGSYCHSFLSTFSCSLLFSPFAILLTRIRVVSFPSFPQTHKAYIGKLNMILVQILKHDWPAKWPSFVPDLVGSSKTSEVRSV